jgi:hypothetical protein
MFSFEVARTMHDDRRRRLERAASRHRLLRAVRALRSPRPAVEPRPLPSLEVAAPPVPEAAVPCESCDDDATAA